MAKILYIDGYPYGMTNCHHQTYSRGYELIVFMMLDGEPVEVYKEDVTSIWENEESISVHCH